MLAANPDLESGSHTAAILDGDSNQSANPLGVEHLEWIIGEDAAVYIGGKEASSVVATQPVRSLSQVVRAEGEKLRACRYLVGGKSRAWKLDHRAYQVFDRLAHHSQHLLRGSLENGALVIELLHRGDEWNHDLRTNVDAASRRTHRGFEDRAPLHLRYLGESDAEPASPVAEHRIVLA